jgi:hypothetical protein
MIMDELNIDYKVAKELLELHGTVRNAIDSKK